jgi:hypothetical protein
MPVPQELWEMSIQELLAVRWCGVEGQPIWDLGFTILD